jgi:hypothetical protein
MELLLPALPPIEIDDAANIRVGRRKNPRVVPIAGRWIDCGRQVSEPRGPKSV